MITCIVIINNIRKMKDCRHSSLFDSQQKVEACLIHSVTSRSHGQPCARYTAPRLNELIALAAGDVM
jgi:hypothetical protein